MSMNEETGQAFVVGTVRTLDQLQQVWSFAASVLPMITAGNHTLPYYAVQFTKTPELLVVAERSGRVCGCILASVDNDHVLVGPVAVASDSRRMGVGAAMMRELEVQAAQIGQRTLILGSLEDVESFYLSCGFQPNLFIQLPEPKGVERLKAVNAGYAAIWAAEQEGWSRLMLRTPRIDKLLEAKYRQQFPSCSTQYVFIKHLKPAGARADRC